jgi:hypothetical protein
MSKVYDIAFWVGVSFYISLFTFLNVNSLDANRSEYENRRFQIAPGGFSWGFPFNWGESYSMIVEGGTIFNLVAAIFGSLIAGLMFNFIWSKIQSATRRQSG